jgi:S1-C subfamily serine protease
MAFDDPHTDRGRFWPVALLVALLVLLVAAVGVVAVQQRDDNRQLRAAVSQLKGQLKDIATTQRAQTDSLSASQKALSTLSGRLDSTEQRQKADEKQLSLTQQELPPDVTKLAIKVSPSVVVLRCAGSLIGSGFSMTLPTGPGFGSVIVTAAHVVQACDRVSGTLTLSYNGADQPVKVRGMGSYDPKATPAALDDVALLDVMPKIPPLEAAPDITVGEFVMAVGSPLSEFFAGNVTTGTVSKVLTTYFLDTASITGGNSGGPVVGPDGRVLGLVQGSYEGAQNLNVSMRLVTICRASLLSGSCPF